MAWLIVIQQSITPSHWIYEFWSSCRQKVMHVRPSCIHTGWLKKVRKGLHFQRSVNVLMSRLDIQSSMDNEQDPIQWDYLLCIHIVGNQNVKHETFMKQIFRSTQFPRNCLIYLIYGLNYEWNFLSNSLVTLSVFM